MDEQIASDIVFTYKQMNYKYNLENMNEIFEMWRASGAEVSNTKHSSVMIK